MNSLPFQRASQIATDATTLTRWLVDGLWSLEAVGIVGGEPKCCKSFLALDLAVSVASGAACLRQFPVRHTGSVLLFPADRQRLTQTVEALQPRLLILDPLIRLHRVDENDATQIAALLSFLRELQRRFHLAVVLVHHARKDSGSSRPGQALRGSSELHGWGDSNLYLRRRGTQLTLSTEHRAAPSQDHLPLALTQSGSALALSAIPGAGPASPEPAVMASATQRVRQALAQLTEPASVQRLRELCGMRTATVCSALAQLSAQGVVSHDGRGYQLKRLLDPPVSLSRPIPPQGNGNRKRSLAL